jgi:hypothetical protein
LFSIGLEIIQLSKDPNGLELEDFVAAHFASDGAPGSKTGRNILSLKVLQRY